MLRVRLQLKLKLNLVVWIGDGHAQVIALSKQTYQHHCGGVSVHAVVAVRGAVE